MITAGIAVVLLLIGGTGTNAILFNAGYAQTVTGSQNQTAEVIIVQNTSMSYRLQLLIMVRLYTQ